MSQIVRPTPTNFVPPSIKQSGVDHVFCLNITHLESLRRALGRRVDKATNQYFHLEDIPPPCDNAPLIERLEKIIDLN